MTTQAKGGHFASFVKDTIKGYNDFIAKSMKMESVVDPKDAATKFSAFFGTSVVLYQIIFAAVFAGVFYAQFINTSASRWLAPTNSSQTGQWCYPVYTILDGSYLIDTNGNWQDSKMFNVSQAIYEVQFTNAKLSHDDWTTAMATIQKRVSNLGQHTAMNQDASWTLTMFASFFLKIYFPMQGYMQFYLTGNSEVIFGASDGTAGLVAETVGIADDKGDLCLPGSGTLGVSLSGTDLAIDIPVINQVTLENKKGSMGSKVIGTGPCNNVFDIGHAFGYQPTLDDASATSFKALIDMRSVSTAIAINSLVVNATDLQEVSAPSPIVGTNYQYRYFVDPYYPDMAYVVCITTVTVGGGFLCGVESSTTSNTFFPFIKHTGYTPGSNVAQKCWTSALYECTQYAIATGKDGGSCSTNRISMAFLFSQASDYSLYDQLYKAGYLVGSRLYTLVENIYPAMSMIYDASSIYDASKAEFLTINGSQPFVWSTVFNRDPSKYTTKSPTLAPLAAGVTTYPSAQPVTKGPVGSAGSHDDIIRTDDTFLEQIGNQWASQNNATVSPTQQGSNLYSSTSNPWLLANFYALGDSSCKLNNTGSWSVASGSCQQTTYGGLIFSPYIFSQSLQATQIAVEIANYSDPFCYNFVSAEVLLVQQGECTPWKSNLFSFPGLDSKFTVYVKVFYSQTVKVPLPLAHGPLQMSFHDYFYQSCSIDSGLQFSYYSLNEHYCFNGTQYNCDGSYKHCGKHLNSRHNSSHVVVNQELSQHACRMNMEGVFGMNAFQYLDKISLCYSGNSLGPSTPSQLENILTPSVETSSEPSNGYSTSSEPFNFFWDDFWFHNYSIGFMTDEPSSQPSSPIAGVSSEPTFPTTEPSQNPANLPIQFPTPKKVDSSRLKSSEFSVASSGTTTSSASVSTLIATNNPFQQCPSTYQSGLQSAIGKYICKDCAMIAVSFSDQTNSNATVVNKDYYSLTGASYANTFYYPAVFTIMAANPPAPLVENYKVCQYDSLNAATTAAGLSWSDTSLVVGFIFFLYLAGWKLYWNEWLYKRNSDATGLITAEDKLNIFILASTALLTELADPSINKNDPSHINEKKNLLAILKECSGSDISQRHTDDQSVEIANPKEDFDITITEKSRHDYLLKKVEELKFFNQRQIEELAKKNDTRTSSNPLTRLSEMFSKRTKVNPINQTKGKHSSVQKNNQEIQLGHNDADDLKTIAEVI